MKEKGFILPPYLKALSVLIFIIVLVFFLIVGKSLLVPLFMGGFFAVLFTPLSNWFEKKKIPRTVSSILSLLVNIAMVVGFLSFIITTVSNFTNDFDNVSEKLSNYAKEIDDWTYSNFGIDENLEEKASDDYIKTLLQQHGANITGFALRTVGSLSGAILIPVFMFFFLLYRDHLTEVMIRIYRDKDPQLVKMRITSLRKLLQNYIIGVVKVMGILAILNVSAFSALGIKHAIFFGIIAAFLNIIPYVGPFIGALMPMIYSFLTKDSLFYPLAVLASYQIIQLIEGNFLTPKIVGGNVNLNPFITFLGLLIGGSIWGIAGMVLIIPTLAILREIFELSDQTSPFALLLGEEEDHAKIERKKEDSD
ncbi:AI-2E family transporter [Algoriphagus halophilus]|uniref:Predicted PurR-regulated permease PerM n=1 Tax=Algoriphagus halophilus TaxID=226505 RepID=A0A1N6DEG0_9BACT|nr:AI-2E family transporter [Algoriphagus halophilus]SIN69190.1 Predicted PurR-regulated permease PerM [Algoriphagus halophilus]